MKHYITALILVGGLAAAQAQAACNYPVAPGKFPDMALLQLSLAVGGATATTAVPRPGSLSAWSAAGGASKVGAISSFTWIGEKRRASFVSE